LISVVEVVGDDCLNIFTSFISNTINHQEWQYRKAAAIAFGAMLDGPSKEKIVPMVLSALPKIVTLL
jgi:importin subunit beta-1